MHLDLWSDPIGLSPSGHLIIPQCNWFNDSLPLHLTLMCGQRFGTKWLPCITQVDATHWWWLRTCDPVEMMLCHHWSQTTNAAVSYCSAAVCYQQCEDSWKKDMMNRTCSILIMFTCCRWDFTLHLWQQGSQNGFPHFCLSICMFSRAAADNYFHYWFLFPLFGLNSIVQRLTTVWS